MMALDLPKWDIDTMEKLCRGFLWLLENHQMKVIAR
jgi:thiamine monophosphate kinase